MKQNIGLINKAVLFAAVVSLGLFANNAEAQRGGRGGGGNGGGNGGGGNRGFSGGGGGRSFGGGAGSSGGGFSRGNSGSFSQAPSRSFNNNRGSGGFDRSPSVASRSSNGGGRPSFSPSDRGGQYRGNPMQRQPQQVRQPQQRFNSGRPVQMRNYSRTSVNINIGGGYRSGFAFNRYSPRFYYGGGFHYRPVYYRPFIAPIFGVRINVLPYGYYPFYWNSDPYFFYNGLYYRQYNNYYETVQPPLGAKVPNLPSGADAVDIDGVRYYEYKGTYYQKTYNENGETLYEVVGTDGVLETDRQAQIDMQQQQSSDGTITALPDGTHTVTLDGKTYFVTPDGDYYQQFTDQNNNIFYVKAGAEMQD